ncbi:MAG TPA: tRNA (adenosine(37)-N6)-threonylcarbamoyltransferase complex dimerization subunit type 1 TsaB [Anaerovoracaceae bacterium]|nr:tRNA (adenosine(37)-N6)-threonylcarbamoyltransferase complex dimerization subunit type 1 TsaB [Anaerovoracaceae bacterium]
MNILAIETTGAEASVAVINEKGEVFMEASDQKLNHLQNLMPMVDILLGKRGLSIDDVDYIAVSEGPGSFTGIRIGVSSARALAQALGLETISVPTLKSFLYHVPEYKGIICPIFDARRSQVYGGAYQWTGKEQYIEVVPGAAYDLQQLLEQLEESVDSEQKSEKEITFFGDGIIPYREQILNWQRSSLNSNIRVLFAEDDLKLQKASSVAKLALESYQAGKVKSLYDLKPVYMRKAEAERKLEGKA